MRVNLERGGRVLFDGMNRTDRMASQMRCSDSPCVRRPDVRRKAGRYIGQAVATSLRSSLCPCALVVLLQEVICGRVFGIQAVLETWRSQEWRGQETTPQPDRPRHSGEHAAHAYAHITNGSCPALLTAKRLTQTKEVLLPEVHEKQPSTRSRSCRLLLKCPHSVLGDH